MMGGSRTLDSMDFKHYNINSFNYLVNNTSVPKVPYKMSWGENNKSFGRIFHSCYNSLSLHNHNESVMLSLDNFERMFLIIQDMTSTNFALTSMNSDLIFSNVGVELGFETPVKESLTLLLYCLIPTKFQINHSRNCEILH